MNEQRENRQSNYIMRGGIMSIAILFAGLCAIIGRVLISSCYANAGIGIFSASFGLFGLFCICFSYMLPIVLRALMLPRVRQHQYCNARAICKVGSLFSIVFSLVGAGLLFWKGQDWAMLLFADRYAKITLMPLCVLLLLCAFNGSLRGYFMGYGVDAPAAISVVIEQFFSVCIGTVLMFVFDDYGAKVGVLLLNSDYAFVYGLLGFYIGMITGSILSLLFLCFAYFSTKAQYLKMQKKESSKMREPLSRSITLFVLFLLPFIILALFLRGNVIFAQIAFRLFVNGSLSDDLIINEWGAYYGIYRVLFAIPLLIAAAMGYCQQTLLPGLIKRQAMQHLRDRLQSVLKASAMFVFPMIVWIGCSGNAILFMLNHRADADLAGKLLLIGIIPTVLFAFSILFIETLFALNEGRKAFICAGIGLPVYLFLLYVMPEVFHLNIFGVLYADLICSFVLFGLCGFFVKQTSGLRGSFFRCLVPTSLASLIMGAVLYFMNRALISVLPAGVLFALLLLTGVLIYHVLLALLHGADERDLKCIPFGRVIIFVLRQIRLM
ncbi:MAG: polysaccharide biosynthesis C-terminal domain-containing protein [Lachnospiraceae bacterium]|nr:polysaccharide biosynthesis C-terminal domain-containing protein [Lachnospiraceae bacterium]